MATDSQPFIMGGYSHIIAVLAVIILGMTLFAIHRRHPQSHIPALLGWASLAAIPFSFAAKAMTTPPPIHWADIMPLHFCDAMCTAVFLALTCRVNIAKPIAYFCTLTATTQGLITPTLELEFPNPAYFAFFYAHGMTVLGALAIPILTKWRAKPTDIWLSIGFGFAYLIAIHPFNLIFDTNFGFTRMIPASGSVLSLFGPWPYYMLTMQIPAMAIMYLLYVPCKKRKKTPKNPSIP